MHRYHMFGVGGPERVRVDHTCTPWLLGASLVHIQLRTETSRSSGCCGLQGTRLIRSTVTLINQSPVTGVNLGDAGTQMRLEIRQSLTSPSTHTAVNETVQSMRGVFKQTSLKVITQ